MKKPIMNVMWRLWLLGTAALCFADTRIDSIEPTQMQAKITVLTDQSGACTYRASRGSSFTSNVPDLVDNGNTDTRKGSLVFRNKHIFVLGTRKGSDALASAATYLIGVTCGSDPEVSAPLTTLAIPWGNMAPDPVPFNANAFGNMDYPVIDWANQMKSYIDPISGVEFWRLTGPGLSQATAIQAQFNVTSRIPIDLSGAGWSGATNAVYNSVATPRSFATASGTPANKLFIPIPNGGYPYFGGNWDTPSAIDDVIVHVFCGNASQGGITFSVQWSFDGGQTLAGSPVPTAACSSSSPVKLGDYPQAKPSSMFHGWGIVSPRHNLVAPGYGTANVNNSVVTIQSPSGSTNFFTTDWPAGTPILINGLYYHVSSIQSPTQLTIRENPGTMTSVPWSGANSGVVLWMNGPGSASVSIGLDIFGSSNASSDTNGDLGMVNPVPVTVTKSADGSQTLDPPLSGNLVVITDGGAHGAILLWIEKNADGTPRNEIRLLSIGAKTASSSSVSLNGDGAAYPYAVGVQAYRASAFDGVNGDRWYGLDSGTKSRFWRMTYNNTGACAGYPAYNPFPGSGGYNIGATTQADDCFSYYNLTPSSAGLDVNTQMATAYQTCKNSAGQSVCPYPHPGFDLGWFNAPQVGLSTAGYLTAGMGTGQDALGIAGVFDINTGMIKSIRDTWGSDPDTEVTWGGNHGFNIVAGTWLFNALDFLNGNNSNTVFGMAKFDMPIDQINRAGYGAPPNWDSNTALGAAEAYTCPPDDQLPLRYQFASMQARGYAGSALGGTTNCIQLRFHTPPCNAVPNTTYRFPDGKTEADEFPCTTPGFGVADPTRSKLMDLRPGDWTNDRADGVYGEHFIILQIQYNGTNDITIWLMRWARSNYLVPILNDPNLFDKPGRVHGAGWFMSMIPPLSLGASATAFDTSAGASAKFLPDHPMRENCHGVMGAGSAVGLYTFTEPCEFYGGRDVYMGNFDSTPASIILQPFTPLAAAEPWFAGSKSGINIMQNYNNGSSLPGVANPPFQVDFRHVNGSAGAGAEYLSSTIGNPRTLTPVAGTAQSYMIQDSVSAGPSDYKRLPLHGWAGRFLLKDVSGPTIGNTGDLPDFSFCRAFNAGECFAGSASGSLYVSVPQAFVDNYCHSDSFTVTAPCVGHLGSYTGQVIQFRLDRPDSTGIGARKFGYAHGMPGLQYQFSNCRTTPDAAFLFCIADWLDGVRSEWVAMKIAPMPVSDSVNRTSFVPVTLTHTQSSGASYIRARFGYLENGGSMLRCTPYQVECSTEIPAAAPDDPYSFTNESVVRQTCGDGRPLDIRCTITIPAISNRMLYYVVDRLDSFGNVVASLPMNVVAVP
ncbi:MAG TPA: hypothetical protein VEU96_28125 [Bryobacteraceae bacterium]|nr:hypothetical protein [Bryobacteraceae bacterium]